MKVIGILILVLIMIAFIPALIPYEDYLPGAKQWLDEANTMAEIPDELNRVNHLDALISLVNLKTDIVSKKIRADNVFLRIV